MDTENICMDSKHKIHISFVSDSEADKAKRLGSINWLLFRTNSRLYSTKMGEITGKFFINFLGITASIWGFLANLPNPVSILLGIVSLMWATYKMLEKREDWLYRRSERRKHEKDNNTNDA